MAPRESALSRLRLGTSSWSCPDWLGVFYPPGTAPADFITEYAKRLSTVEVDATFYRIPAQRMVEGWKRKTPEGFLFSLKAPQIITHTKFLQDCQAELDLFLRTVSSLEDRLGPILFQFPYFAKGRGVTLDAFLERLAPFLTLLPKEGFRFALEIRNKAWLREDLFGLLREHAIALALIDHPYMPRPADLLRGGEVVTGPFVYIRWLGDRYGIEKMTQAWNKSVIDKTDAMKEWIEPVWAFLDAGLPVFAYANNHFSGFAPVDVERFQGMMSASATA